ncbi:MAG: hypothetical protein R3Y36_00405 [Spirochaetales bacterium]
MDKIYFSVIGAGWRSRIFFRLAKEMPELFGVTEVVARNPKTAKEIQEKWGYKVVSDISELKNIGEFTILSLPQQTLPSVIKECNDKGFFVLAETFEVDDVTVLNDFYKSIKNPQLVQIAEQYAFQPMHSVRLQLIKEGVIGDVTQAIISSGHGYHGTSLLRRYLGKTFENCSIKGKLFNGKVVQGPGRAGYPEKEILIDEEQQSAFLDYGDSMGFYYFTWEQYFSRIRRPHLLIRGTHGEISNATIRTLADFKTPVEYDIIREMNGNNEMPNDLGLAGLTAANKWCYLNKYANFSLSDDEIAVATALENMAIYVRGGKPAYSLEEGLQDQYLSIMIKESFKTAGEITTTTQSFAKK